MNTETTTRENSKTQKPLHEELKPLVGKYLGFALGDETYGINILKVREIIGLQSITRVPDTNSALRGVINLRGQVIAVLDLRLKFGMEPAKYNEETCIIITEAGHLSTGLIVDRVDEVANFNLQELEPAPEFHASLDTRFILAMGKGREKLLILLDSDAVLKSLVKE